MEGANPFAAFARSGSEIDGESSKRKAASPIRERCTKAKKCGVAEEPCIEKWHSFARDTSDLQSKRFEILVAARLHARAQEKVVRAALENLRKELGKLTVEAMADADVSKVAETIKNVHFNNAKARQLVQAANFIRTRCYGELPVGKARLMRVPGIGPMLAELLASVTHPSTFWLHEDELQASGPDDGEAGCAAEERKGSGALIGDAPASEPCAPAPTPRALSAEEGSDAAADGGADAADGDRRRAAGLGVERANPGLLSLPEAPAGPRYAVVDVDDEEDFEAEFSAD